MYKKSRASWLKHIDFCVLDIICLELALLLANAIRYYNRSGVFRAEIYRDLAIVGIFISIAVAIFFGTFKNVLKKSVYADFADSFKQTTLVIIILLLYLYLSHRSYDFSRIVFVLAWLIYLFLSYSTRLIWKALLKKWHKGKGRSLLIITTENAAEKCIKGVQSGNFEVFHISGLVIVDRDMVGDSISGVEVVATERDVADYVKKQWVDEVFIDNSVDNVMQSVFTSMICEMGVTVHCSLLADNEAVGEKKLVNRIGRYVVLTTSMNYASSGKLFVKRIIDIIGGLVGTFITGILFLVFFPIIRIQSPGPVFFTQTRVGKNGKKFKMYKFRTMHLDAEQRKKDLMALNRLDDNYMFKLDFDPRVIGNKVLPDGTYKTGFMEFARKLSLDEFPQFINVLKGDMSLVGTRPPTLEEYKTYKPHHNARLAIRPGVTGLWQVSGRSNITNFEDVVRLDTQYINEWSLSLDLKILLKTVKVLFKQEGAM